MFFFIDLSRVLAFLLHLQILQNSLVFSWSPPTDFRRFWIRKKLVKRVNWRTNLKFCSFFIFLSCPLLIVCKIKCTFFSFYSDEQWIDWLFNLFLSFGIKVTKTKKNMPPKSQYYSQFCYICHINFYLFSFIDKKLDKEVSILSFI